MAIDSIVESEKNRVRYLRVEEANDVSYDDVESLFDDDFNGEYLLDISECQSYDPPTKYLSPFISLMISKGVNLKINGSQKKKIDMMIGDTCCFDDYKNGTYLVGYCNENDYNVDLSYFSLSA